MGENLFYNLLSFLFSIAESENHIFLSLCNSSLVEQQCNYTTVSGHIIASRVFAYQLETNWKNLCSAKRKQNMFTFSTAKAADSEQYLG